MTDKKTQTEIRKELLQARHRAEEAQARNRVKERNARTRRLIYQVVSKCALRDEKLLVSTSVRFF